MRPTISCSTFFDSLLERGFTHLFHANSVETSISYFRVAALLSRGDCESQSLPQSQQWSDKLDKQYNIWNDVFLNFNDFHINFKKPNHYGPILFCFNLQSLKTHLETNGLIHITKTQPHKWNESSTDNEKWRSDMLNLFKGEVGTGQQKFINGWGDIVLSNLGPSGLPLSLCDKVIIDVHPNNINFFSQVSSAFSTCMKAQNLNFAIEKRSCSIAGCKCGQWRSVTDENNEHKYTSGGWEAAYGKIA